MLAAVWSMKLVGLGVLLALQASPSNVTGKAATSPEQAEAGNSQVDLAGNFGLVLGSPDASGKVAVCLGASVGVSGTDPYRRAAAVAEMELRREFVSKAFHERFGNSSSRARSLDIVNADRAAICVSAPTASVNDAVSVVLEALRPTSLTAERWSEVVQRWRNHEGLATTTNDNPLQRQLQSLIWLGTPEATVSITQTIEQSLGLHGERVARSAPTRLQKPVLVMTGEYSRVDVERYIRLNPLVREFTRVQGRTQPPQQAIPEPKAKSPRFTRERMASLDGHLWLFGWPISHLDAAHVSGVEVLARLLERYLTEQTPLGKAGLVNCLIQSQHRYASLVVEVRSKSLGIEAVEKWVWSGVEQLKNGQFNRAEIKEAIERAKAQVNPNVAEPLDRAWSIAARSFFPMEAASQRDMWSLSQPELSRIARQDLDHRQVSEIFGEALPPRPKAIAFSRGTSPTNRTKRSQTKVATPIRSNRGPGRIYTVQHGESLQMIAHRFHVTVPEIIRENRLSHPDQVSPGTKIFVPQPPSSVRMAP
jgi:hypothetical protein